MSGQMFSTTLLTNEIFGALGVTANVLAGLFVDLALSVDQVVGHFGSRGLILI
jgi:hypothetical protein